jgi:pSer/pThr/pTyr-binding forkhead associated (FHA) protein
MPASLVISIPNQPSHEVTLERASYHIGRDEDNDIVLESSTVSRRHGILERRGEKWVYTDLNSRNGSFVDGKPIQEATMGNGMTVQLGKDPGKGVTIIFRIGKAVLEREPEGRVVGMETIREKEESTTGLNRSDPICFDPAKRTKTTTYRKGSGG